METLKYMFENALCYYVMILYVPTFATGIL